MKKINVNTNIGSYNIYIGNKILNKIEFFLKKNNITSSKFLIIIDSNVPKKLIKQIILSLKKKKKIIYFFNSNEKNKNQKTINKLLEILLNNNFHRNDCLISVGGGITSDLSGFAASIYKRGIKYINIPTTLLNMVDASLGGKQGYNTKYGKNLIGSFYQPHLVISDTSFLKYLPKREIICGYAEILKHSLIMGKKFFNYLDKNAENILKLKKPFLEKAIFQSCLIKKKIIEKDEDEKDIRQILNFGHTFAHAFEATNNYSKKLNHGEAVLLGMICAINFAKKNSGIKKNDYKKIIDHYKKLNLPFKIKNFFSRQNIKKILSFMQKDKKNNNMNINLVLLNKIGKVSYNRQFTYTKINRFLKAELVN